MEYQIEVIKYLAWELERAKEMQRLAQEAEKSAKGMQDAVERVLFNLGVREHSKGVLIYDGTMIRV